MQQYIQINTYGFADQSRDGTDRHHFDSAGHRLSVMLISHAGYWASCDELPDGEFKARFGGIP